MVNIGIWMDKRRAIILRLKDELEFVTTVDSEIETYHVHGGSGSRMKGGPQDVVQDSKYLEREKHQFKNYSKEIAKKISNGDRIVIFGPAEAGLRFYKELKRNHNAISKNVVEVLKADSMTENQILAHIRNYYKNQ